MNVFYDYATLRRVIWHAAWAALLFLLTSGAALAAVVFEQPPDNGLDAYASFYTDETADDFSFPAETTVESLIWYGTYFDDTLGVPDVFEINFYSDNSGLPNRPAFSTFSQNAMTDPLVVTSEKSNPLLTDVVGATVYQYNATLPVSQVFSAGQTYYLSIVNLFDELYAEWFWLLSNESGSNYYRDGSIVSFERYDDGDLAFTLNGSQAAVSSVPAPAPLLLMLPVLGFVHRMRCIKRVVSVT